jgi:hypothetical protein
VFPLQDVTYLGVFAFSLSVELVVQNLQAPSDLAYFALTVRDTLPQGLLDPCCKCVSPVKMILHALLVTCEKGSVWPGIHVQPEWLEPQACTCCCKFHCAHNGMPPGSM